MNNHFSRRDALSLSALGLGGLALNGLPGISGAAEENSLTPQTPHHEPKARRVIFLVYARRPESGGHVRS